MTGAGAGPAGKVALITGASGGIGAASVRALSRQGARVALTYLSNREAAEALAAEVGGAAYALDVRDRQAMPAMLARLRADLGEVQILVLNAGTTRDALLPFLGAAETPTWAVLIAFGFSVTTGLVFGLVPALRAADVEPLVSLHQE